MIETKPNLERLKLVLKYAPDKEHLDMRRFGANTGCGTTYCLVGNYAVTTGGNHYWLNDFLVIRFTEDMSIGIFDGLLSHFNITKEQFIYLFGYGNCGLTYEQVIYRLSKFIAVYEARQQYDLIVEHKYERVQEMQYA
jgi:hypothetical protein